ncbi:GFA family protein [Photobacterium galatheae]|uniref:Aldehyde-activating protein n=1 Tax=Photobacterium galatheae TaxID=1654360 RepID=A0A066RH73_9GAMM|nr:GFA family protein [Photobacterium galatheae]KDM89785.1 aldehyde-activating protein [Photobacterium galatheae]MCM0151436.1 GFA family protein [Photobacterium galatheae]
MHRIKPGACLCGAVQFEIEGDFDAFYLCHCQRCQKDTGSAHAANLFSTTATLRWLSGQEKVNTFTLPSTRHQKSFCTVCGAALPTLQSQGNLLVVPAGSLNQAVDIPPTAHLFTSSKAHWDHDLQEIPMYSKLPE